MNSTPSSNPPAPDSQPPELPALHTGELDAEQLKQLFRDVATATEFLFAVPKYGAQAHVPEQAGVSLADAQQLLETRAVRGVQLRYRYDGAEWWDTIMVIGDRFRVVRIRHEF